MRNLVSLAALVLASAFVLPANAYADAIDRPAAADDVSLAFAEIVNRAVAECRVELAGDAFANFRMEACVESKVIDFIEKSDTPQLAAYAAGQGAFLLAAAP